MSGKGKVDQFSGIETTGHNWDGIEELNNPLPRWWLWTFYATILFAIGYCIAYPAWPMLSGATKGALGWSSRGQIESELAQVEQSRAATRDKIKAATIDQVIADKDLLQFATAAGASLFKVNCVQCHGSGAQGGPGFPNLNDDSWLFGGKPDQILQTINHGVRAAGDNDTRLPPDMPKFGVDNILTAEQISQVAEHVLKISGQQADAALAAPGEKIYADNCAACHGNAGEGNMEQGVPQLNDAIWLRGGTKADIVAQVTNPKLGMMPAWGPRLGDEAVKELAVYVHGLGGGQ
jgi:cytochrome c oxidase cbb3-type subunit 3